MKRWSIVFFASSVLSLAPASSNAFEGLRLNLSPGVALAPANVNVRAGVDRDADNRGLEITAESDEFFRSSYIALDGDRAPVVTEISLKGLPSGHYRVSVVLHGSQGIRSSVTKPLMILGSSEER